MDVVFKEEKEHLEGLERIIDKEAASIEEEIKEQKKIISEFVCVDYSDRQELASLRKELRIKQDEDEELRGYQDSPYFGRMDLEAEDSSDIEKFYIGKQGIIINHDIYVLDWRSPVGQYFYIKTERKFRINTTEYILQLRRALEVQNAELISYNTEYDGQAISLEGDVIDPFLLTVLQDKRRQNRLTDIIRTIQENQNSIIRRSQNESFIVQGCAGSGKTMILLHRLSYLLFNNKRLNNSRIKIITPNKTFDVHINELSKELGLEEIERNSVEEFYVSLIKQYSHKMEVSSSVNSEKELNSDLLKDIYSIKYYEDSIEHYHQYWDEVLAKIESLPLNDIAERLSFVCPKEKDHTKQAYQRLDKYLNDMGNAISSSIKTQRILKEQLESIRDEYEKARSSKEEAKAKLAITKEISESRLRTAIDNDNRLEREINAGIVNAHAQIEGANQRIEDTTRAIESLNYGIERVYTILNNTSDHNGELYETLIHSWDDSEVLRKLETEIYNIETEVKRLPVFGFSKRNQLKNRLTDLKRRYSIQEQEIVKVHIASLESEVREKQAELRETEELIKRKNREISDAQRTLVRIITEKKNLTRALEFILSAEYPDPDSIIKELTEVPDAIKSYEGPFRTYSGTVLYEQACFEKQEQLKKEYDSVSETRASEYDIELIEQAHSYVNQLRLSEISKNVMLRDMTTKYREYGERYRKDNYRHKLYIKLLFCSLYFSSRFPEMFLNIDEAQDISLPEYRLIKSILGSRSIYNLYGDTNQLVYDYKGINNWENLSDIITPTVFALNENYRNTLQITQFCNKEFSADVFPIGISGPEVQELNTKAAIDWIINRKKTEPGSRVAVIYRYGVFDIKAELSEYFIDVDVSWFVVDDNKVSIISVENAKGLEFDEVVAIIDHMTLNEKYISYTRALNELVVVRDRFNKRFDISITADDSIEQEDILNDEPQTQEEISLTEDYNDTSNANDISGINTHQNKDNTINTAQADILQPFLEEVDKYLVDAFGEEQSLNDEQKTILVHLLEGDKVAFDAPSGSKKSIILYLLAKYLHRHKGLQAIITAEAYLQENELVLAEKLGLLAGSITSSLSTFEADFKKDRYDVIFISYDFFANENDVKEFIAYFKGKVSCWGIDHPEEERFLWDTLYKAVQDIGCTSYLMSKTGFDGIVLSGYSEFKVGSEALVLDKKHYELKFASAEEKDAWLSDNTEKLFGQGIIYCETEESCKRVSKILRKKKIKAESYINVTDINNADRINYLSNAFSKGSLPVLVTLHDTGKNISNPAIRFIVHYDIPKNAALYELHTTQIGQLAEEPEVYDFII